MEDIINLHGIEQAEAYSRMREFIEVMDTNLPIIQKLEQLPPLTNLGLNNFFCKINPALRQEFFFFVTEKTLSLPLETDPRKRTFKQLWKDIDNVGIENNLDLLIDLPDAKTARAYISHIGLVYQAQQTTTSTRFAAYKTLTKLGDLEAEEKLNQTLNFYKQYLQLFLILTEEEGYPKEELIS